MNDVRISRAAAILGVSPAYLKILEKEGRIPPARRDRLGDRVYGPLDIALLRVIGVGQGRIREPEELEELVEAGDRK